MSWRRQTVPQGGDLGSHKAYLERTFQNLDAEINRLNGIVAQLVALRVIGGVSAPWLWDDTGTTPADPGAGYVRANSANLNGATALYISKTDAAGRTIVVGESGRVGEPILLTSQTGSAHVIGTIASVTDNGTYVTWTLSGVTGSGNPLQGEVFVLRWYPTADDIEG